MVTSAVRQAPPRLEEPALNKGKVDLHIWTDSIFVPWCSKTCGLSAKPFWGFLLVLQVRILHHLAFRPVDSVIFMPLWMAVSAPSHPTLLCYQSIPTGRGNHKWSPRWRLNRQWQHNIQDTNDSRGLSYYCCPWLYVCHLTVTRKSLLRLKRQEWRIMLPMLWLISGRNA